MINLNSIKSKNLKINGNKVYLIMLNESNISDKYVNTTWDLYISNLITRDLKLILNNLRETLKQISKVCK